MKIGIDLDGVITPIGLINPSLNLPRWLYIFVVPIILLMIPDKKEELKRIATNHEIIIISARPKWSQKLTEKWLRYHKIPFDKIYCVGFGKGTKQRKLKIIEKEGIKFFVDNDSRITKFLNGNSIKVISELKLLNGVL
jgi:uncharacterized HAD superfamily protein